MHSSWGFVGFEQCVVSHSGLVELLCLMGEEGAEE